MQTKIDFSLTGRELAARKPLQISADSAANIVGQLPSLGIHGIEKLSMDNALTGLPGRSGATASQYLQAWLPGIVRQMTTVRAIDRIVGMAQAGNWYDDVVVQQTSQPVGKAELYGDSSNIPLANYAHAYETRGIVRFEQGFEVTQLAEAREAAGQINMATEKRAASMQSLEIARNRLGFFGFFNGTTRAFGLLNDPGLPAYGAAAAKQYTAMTFDELVAEFSLQFSTIMTQSGGNVDGNSNFVIVLPTGYSTILTKPNTLGMTVMTWLKDNFPNVRIEYAPEFVTANGGANVAYFYAESAEDGSPDGGQAIVQIVPAKFFAIGSERRTKGYIEDFGCATAGVMVKRPMLFRRRTGV